jgi:hypothetical protein
VTLLTPGELDALSAAEQTADRFTSQRPAATWGQQPAMLWLPPWPDERHEKFARACMGFAEAERLRVTTTGSTAAAVVAAAEAGMVKVVLAACRWQGGGHDEIEPVLIGLGVRLVIVRDRPHRTRTGVNPAIARLLGMGLTADQVADALDAPVDQIGLVAIQMQGADRRPGPGHPWRGRQASVVDLEEARRTRRVS